MFCGRGPYGDPPPGYIIGPLYWLSMCGMRVMTLGSSLTGLKGCGEPATDSVPSRRLSAASGPATGTPRSSARTCNLGCVGNLCGWSGPGPGPGPGPG